LRRLLLLEASEADVEAAMGGLDEGLPVDRVDRAEHLRQLDADRAPCVATLGAGPEIG